MLYPFLSDAAFFMLHGFFRCGMQPGDGVRGRTGVHIVHEFNTQRAVYGSFFLHQCSCCAENAVDDSIEDIKTQ